MTENATGYQKIECEGTDSHNSYDIYGNDVHIVASWLNQTESITASNKVKIKQISKFDWEEKFYFGNLVSNNNIYIAYVLPGKSQDDCVRVMNYHTSLRVLLRGFTHKVVDVCFESLSSNLLACVDSKGTLFVFKIFEENNNTKSQPILTLWRDEPVSPELYRVIWSPKVLSASEEADTLIAFSSGTQVDVINLTKIVKDDFQELNFSELTEGVITIKDCHKKAITSLAVSPDNQILATSSLDGDVKFWSIVDDENRSCMVHEWEPHEGEPVTSLFFCDNLLSADDTTPFWRYLITGTHSNSTLKVWCAVNWICIQTLTFKPNESNSSKVLCMKVMLDITSKYLIISEVFTKVLYICKLHQDKEKDLSIVSLSEFILKEPQLSFSIATAKVFTKPERDGTAEELNDETAEDVVTVSHDDDDTAAGSPQVCVVRLFAIQKRAMQKLNITFSETTGNASRPQSFLSLAASSQEDLLDRCSDMEAVSCDERPAEPSDITNVSSLNHNVSSLNNTADTTTDSTTPEDSTTVSSVSDILVSPITNIRASPDTRSISPLPILRAKELNEEAPAAREEREPQANNMVNGDSELSNESTKKILEMLQSQQRLIQSQQQEMCALKEMVKTMSESMSIDDLKVHSTLLQKSASSHFNKSCNEITRIFNEKLDMTLKDFHQKQQILLKQMEGRLEKSLRNDINLIMHPFVDKIKQMESKSLHMQQQQIPKFVGLEKELREEVQKVLRSKPFIDGITAAAATALNEIMPSTYRQMFETAILPGCEKATQEMFKSLAEVFKEGTHEYLDKLERHLNDHSATSNSQLSDEIKKLLSSNENYRNLNKQFEDQLTKQLASLQQSVSTMIDSQFEKAFRKWMYSINQTSLMVQDANAQQQISQDETKSIIKKHIEEANYHAAFNMALDAGNLSLVIFTCKQVDVSKVFAKKKPLPQNYTLCLIQQLSSDLMQDTDTKLDYLRYAIISLDTKDECTRNYSPQVLATLNENLRATVRELEATDPTSSLIHGINFLLLIAEKYDNA